MVHEGRLAALAVGVKTGIVIDIGESGLSVTPIFDGCPVAPAVRSESCGGGDVTSFLDYMLLSRTNEQFNQMVGRIGFRLPVEPRWLSCVGGVALTRLVLC